MKYISKAMVMLFTSVVMSVRVPINSAITADIAAAIIPNVTLIQ